MATPQKRTCFVISPIGAEGTDTRKLADDFLELLVEPALAKYGFEVVRGDRIANSSAITTDIVRLVQESDLCIIDLTSNNPNVFYECGRRHETGRPFIQMIRKGDDKAMPFDVAGIRTVIYDIASPRGVLESQKRLQDFIDSLVASGFEAGASGESLSSIAQSLERIERKLGALLTSPPASVGHAKSSSDGDDEDLDFGASIRDISGSPRETFMRALKRNDIDRALSILPRLEKIVDKKEYVAALALLLSLGSARGFEILDQLVQDMLADPLAEQQRDDILQGAAQAYMNFFTNIGELDKGSAAIESLANAALASDAFSKDTKAFAMNKVGMLAWNRRDFSKCITATKLAFDLKPDPSYAYNLVLAYDHLKMKDELAKALESLSKLPELDADHRRMLKKHGFAV